MSLVLQLDVKSTAVPGARKEEATKTGTGNEKQQPVPTLMFAQKVQTPESVTAASTDSSATVDGNTMAITSSGDAAVMVTTSKVQSCTEPAGNYQHAVSTASPVTTVKSVVTYPVAKGSKEQMQKTLSGSQTNTTQVLTTRVISQKLPSPSSGQAQPVPITTLNVPSHQASLSSSGSGGITYPLQTTICTVQSSQPAKNQNAIGELVHSKRPQQATSNVQATLHKLQPISVQQHIINTATAVKTITAATMVSNLQRIHVKTASPNIVAVGQSAQTVNLQKVKTVTNLANNQPVGIVQRNNSLSKIQGVQKSLSGQINQLSVNNQATANNVNNSQKIQQSTPMMLQKTTQSIHPAMLQSVCGHQKVPSLNSSHKSNHKTQQQQNVQQKLQSSQKTLVITKQQQQLTAQQMNNISKSNGSVTGVQKTQTIGQQPSTSQQTQAASHQRSQSATAALQKSQTLTTVQTAKRVQPATSNVCKSNSVPNISNKMLPQNSTVLTIGKQQQITSQQQQLQLLQPSQQQPVIQKSQNMNNLQAQRSHGITSVHKKSVTSMPNNQRTQSVMNSKIQQQQQQMMMRVGIPKGGLTQVSQSALALGISQKLVNTVKLAANVNSQNDAVQQPVQRNNNPPLPMKIIQQQQQQQQTEIGQLTPAQKQLGCIKTIPPQKSVQRNHVQRATGIKSSMNTNTTLTKTQNSVIASQVTPQKTIIKTLLPQQTAMAAVATASSGIMVTHKHSPIKIQQQQLQQKQLFMTPQCTQQIRQQAGQIKTLLPITPIEFRKDFVEIKNDTELRTFKEEDPNAPRSPVRRMPLPYECLQFVLQDHNYGAPPPRTPPPSSPPPHPKQQAINGAGSSATTLQHPYIFGPVVSNTLNAEDDAASAISSEAEREAEPEGEETETAPEGEGDDEDSVTRCICDFEHDDGYMICCDRCLVWQHVDCMGIDRSNIPDEYLCEKCRPRRVDRQRARALQMRKREELLNSDTSSDTSSTSSADTDVGVNSAATQKKRSLSQQQSHVPRRNKSDVGSAQSAAQVRKLNNNNNVAKRQRRDSHARQSSAVRKKENAVPKRGPGKRKAKRRMSIEDKEEDPQEVWSGGGNMAPLRQWIEKYEEAMTNHYSPELRARISSIKVNGTHSDLRQANMNVLATGKCRLNVHSNNVRFLVATMYLSPNTPVVELRGKYMLSTQHRPQHQQGSRQHVQRPGPFVFFYRLPRDGTEVCVDTRTYGNDARFVRRSCKPNAEVKHCIEKGTLHLYIVTTCAIEKNAEITIKYEQHDLLLSPNPNPTTPAVCACNSLRDCQIALANHFSRRASNGALVENADGRERRRRSRRNTGCEELEPAPPVVYTSSVMESVITATPVNTVTTLTPKRTVTTTVTTPMTRQIPKEEVTATAIPSPQPQTSPSLSQSTVVTVETKKDKKKMTREERKMEAIMKAFERLEKAEQRKQEVQARNAQRKESSGTHSDNEDSHMTTGQSKSSKQTNNSERPLRRKRRKGRARTTSSSQSQSGSSRRTRLNSADSDVSSGDESNSMQSPPLLSQKRPSSRDVSYSHLHTPAKSATPADGTRENVGSASGNQRIPTAAGLLLALANSNVPGPPSSPPLLQPTPVKSPTCDSGASSSSQSSTPSTPLSSACLLVAAAVGPLAPGFKFPKTKKVLMNEWLKESPDPPQANVPQVSPMPALPSTPILPNSMNSISLCGRSSDFPSLTATDPSVEFLSQSYAAKSLATLVQAANSVGGICDSPPQHKQQQQQQLQASAQSQSQPQSQQQQLHQMIAIPSNNSNSSGCIAVSTGSAKKRWLRQAISEECDSPNSRPESPPLLNEKVAPPKKRRIARESLSSENYTPPTTPTMLLPSETVANSRSLCPTEDDYAENVQSPVVEQNDEKHYESEFMREEINVDGEPVDSNELVAREKLSINIPQSDFYIKCKKKREHLGNVKTEVSFVVETENVTMNNEVSPKCESRRKAELNFSPLQMDPKIFAKIREVVESKIDFGLNDFHTSKEPSTKKQAQQVVAKGTVEIIDQDEPNVETEELDSPIAVMEPDTILKQRVAEMQLEFGGNINEIMSVANSENAKSGDKKKVSSEVAIKCREIVERSDDNASIDEFDVEAQMKKITGDDGNDYQEKITSSEKDKSVDGIEGLMESSKEDSDSEDKDIDDEKYCESSFKLFNANHEKTTLVKESELTKSEEITVTEITEDNEVKETSKDTRSHEPLKEVSKTEQSFVLATLSEESIFEATCSNMDVESAADPPKIFHSIPPLSERIRKKPDPAVTPKTPKMDFEAAIIESTINMDTADESKNGEQKLILSTALRELLEAKLDDVSTVEVMKNDIDNEISVSSQVIKPTSDPSERSLDIIDQDSTVTRQEAWKPEETPVKEEEVQPKEIKRLKDPRTVVPNNMPAPSTVKSDAVPPAKRKLSISEYRKRKQQSSVGAATEPESLNEASVGDKSGARGRSDSASSGTSSLSSDEEGSKTSLSLDLPGLATLTPFANAVENDEKKGGEEGAIGWSAAPTTVERQRENLTERLKREFGLFLGDEDDEERARKHGLSTEAIIKAHRSPPHNMAANTAPGYPGPGLPQLPPQPYIPPPGSASIHYPQFQNKSGIPQYPSFPTPSQSAAAQTAYGTAATSPQQKSGSANSKQQAQQQFLIPQASQAPPGSNPYPPQFVQSLSPPQPPPPPSPPPPPPSSSSPPSSLSQASVTETTVAIPSPLPSSGNQTYSPAPSGQSQKQFFSHSASKS